MWEFTEKQHWPRPGSSSACAFCPGCSTPFTPHDVSGTVGWTVCYVLPLWTSQCVMHYHFGLHSTLRRAQPQCTAHRIQLQWQYTSQSIKYSWSVDTLLVPYHSTKTQISTQTCKDTPHSMAQYTQWNILGCDQRLWLH